MQLELIIDIAYSGRVSLQVAHVLLRGLKRNLQELVQSLGQVAAPMRRCQEYDCAYGAQNLLKLGILRSEDVGLEQNLAFETDSTIRNMNERRVPTFLTTSPPIECTTKTMGACRNLVIRSGQCDSTRDLRTHLSHVQGLRTLITPELQLNQKIFRKVRYVEQVFCR